MSTLQDNHYAAMSETGVFVDTGDMIYFGSQLPDICSEDFENWLSMLLRTSSRNVFSCPFVCLYFQTEAGCRVIINVYLHYAIDKAVTTTALGHIAVFPEVAVEHPNTPPLGSVTGIIDYIVAHTAGGRYPPKER